MTDDADGTIQIELNRDEMMHLLTHGTAVVQKDAGPLRIDIKTETKLRTEIVAEHPEEEPEPINDE